jgi:hypothetical protein
LQFKVSSVVSTKTKKKQKRVHEPFIVPLFSQKFQAANIWVETVDDLSHVQLSMVVD